MSNQICSMDKYKSMKKDKENQVNKNMNVSYHNSKQNNHDYIDKNKRKDFYSCLPYDNEHDSNCRLVGINN